MSRTRSDTPTPQPGSWPSALVWTPILLLMSLLLFCAWQGPDIFYHLYLGKQVLETHTFQPSDPLLAQQPSYVNVYWLFQVIIYLVHSVAGIVGLQAAFLLVWLGILLVWTGTTRVRTRPGAGLPLALAALLILSGRFDPRPEVFSYLILALQIHWMARWDFQRELPVRRLLLMGASEAVWANIHGYFLLGPAVIGLSLVASGLQTRSRAVVVNHLKLLAAVLVASVLSPFGWKTWTFAFTLWEFFQQMRGSIYEIRPPTGDFLQLWTVLLFWVYWAVTLASVVWALLRRTRALFPALLALTGLALAAGSIRNLPIFILFSGPFWGTLLARQAGASHRSRAGAAVAAATAIVALGLSAWIVQGGFFRSLKTRTAFEKALAPYNYPVHFAAYLRENPFDGKIYNNSRDGSFLEFYFPRVRPYMDPRYIEVPVVAEYFRSLRDPVVFHRLHQRHSFDAVLLNLTENGELLAALMRDPRWRLVYGDLQRAFLVSVDSPLPMPEAQPIRYYRGEDLSRAVNGAPAIGWILLFVQTGDRGRMLEALRQFREARGVPSVVIEYALQYGLQRDDWELIDLGRSLYPKMIALSEKDRLTVERLLAMATAKMMRRGTGGKSR